MHCVGTEVRLFHFKCGIKELKYPQKLLLHKNTLMIWSIIKILPLVFTYFITNLRKKNITITLKTVTYCVKQLILISIQLIKEYRSTVIGLIKTILDKALYKLHLTKILKENHHPIKSK